MGIIFDPHLPIPRQALPLPDDRSVFIINCVWSPPKVNAHHLAVLARIIDGVHMYNKGIGVAPPKLQFRFFTPMRQEFVPDVMLGIASLRRDLQYGLRGTLYADSVEVVMHTTSAAAQYLSEAAAGHLALDSFPFGGCNTVMVRLDNNVNRSCI